MSGTESVLVIGGGATGTGIARDLALRGVDVTLVEREGLSSGTTGRSHGLLHSGARYAESDPTGARECIEENKVLKSIAGQCIRDTGGVFLQLEEDDPQYFDRKREACREAGIPTEQVDPRTLQERVPDLVQTIERAIRVPDAVIYPSRLVAANAADAVDHGATIHLHTPIEDLETDTGRVTGARLGGRVDSWVTPEYVVNATGAWAGHVASMAGLDVEMAPARGVMVSVDYAGLGPVLNRCRSPDDGDIIVPHETEVVLGTTSVPSKDPDEFERAEWEIETCVEECAAMLPPVADAEIRRTWWGVRPLYAPDEMETDRRGISRGFFRLDHATAGIENMTSIVGGKLTTYRLMAAATTDLVCDRLGIAAECETAESPLPGYDDPERLDSFVARFDGQGPTDKDVTGIEAD